MAGHWKNECPLENVVQDGQARYSGHIRSSTGHMNISLLDKNDRDIVQRFWDMAHADGISVTGLGQSLMLAIAHLRLQNANAHQIEAIDTAAKKLYGMPLSPIVARVMDEASSEAKPLLAIRSIGRIDAASGNILQAVTGDDDALLTLAAGNAFRSGEDNGFNSSRWATAERHYWEGVTRSLSHAILERRDRAALTNVEEEVEQAEKTGALDAAVLRYRTKAVRILDDNRSAPKRFRARPSDHAILAEAVYAASTAEELSCVNALIDTRNTSAELEGMNNTRKRGQARI